MGLDSPCRFGAYSPHTTMGMSERQPPELMSGTVDLLILKSLAGGQRHGYAIAQWGASENNRRARFYTLTAAGRKHLLEQSREFDLVVTAIQRVLRTA